MGKDRHSHGAHRHALEPGAEDGLVEAGRPVEIAGRNFEPGGNTGLQHEGGSFEWVWEAIIATRDEATRGLLTPWCQQ